MMFTPSTPSPDAFINQVTRIDRGDRWFLYRRLQELNIRCWCPPDGSLLVEVENCIDAILLRSTVQQMVSSRQELIDWLERCWDTEFPQCEFLKGIYTELDFSQTL